MTDAIRLPAQPCPSCGKHVDAIASTDAHATTPPRAGDVSVCFYCAEPAVFHQGPLGWGLRKPTAEELAEFAVDHEHIARRVKEFHAAREGT